MEAEDQLIVDIINAQQQENVQNFSLLVQLSKEDSKSKALLIERIKHIQEHIFPRHAVECWSTKHFYSYNDKEKSTYFHAILFCKIKRK